MLLNRFDVEPMTSISRNVISIFREMNVFKLKPTPPPEMNSESIPLAVGKARGSLGSAEAKEGCLSRHTGTPFPRTQTRPVLRGLTR